MKKIEEEKLNVGGYLNYYKGYMLDNGMDCVDIARALSHVMDTFPHSNNVASIYH